MLGDNDQEVMGRIESVVSYIICGAAAVGAEMISNPAGVLDPTACRAAGFVFPTGPVRYDHCIAVSR